MEGCRGVVVMGRLRDPKTFHKNRKLNLLFFLFLKDRCVKNVKKLYHASLLSHCLFT